MESRVQQIDVRQHQDQRNDDQGAQEDNPGERTDLPMGHDIKKLLPAGSPCQPLSEVFSGKGSKRAPAGRCIEDPPSHSVPLATSSLGVIILG